MIVLRLQGVSSVDRHDPSRADLRDQQRVQSTGVTLILFLRTPGCSVAATVSDVEKGLLQIVLDLAASSFELVIVNAGSTDATNVPNFIVWSLDTLVTSNPEARIGNRFINDVIDSRPCGWTSARYSSELGDLGPDQGRVCEKLRAGRFNVDPDTALLWRGNGVTFPLPRSCNPHSE
jgi:hypothetical protein